MGDLKKSGKKPSIGPIASHLSSFRVGTLRSRLAKAVQLASEMKSLQLRLDVVGGREWRAKSTRCSHTRGS